MNDIAVYNERLLERLQDDGLEKFAAKESEVIRDKIWEAGFARKLFPPKSVTRDDRNIQEDLEEDRIYYLVHAETMTHAMTVSFRGNAPSRVWKSKKFAIPFFKIETLHFYTDEATIRSMPYRFTDEIERKFPLMLQVVEDRELILHLEACAQWQQYWANGNSFAALNASGLAGASPPVETGVRKSEAARTRSTDDFIIVTPTRADFAYLAAMFPGTQGEQLVADSFLISQPDWERINTWAQATVGSEGAWQITKEGYVANTIIGRRVFKTAKTGVLRPGNVYAFAPKEFGGKFLTFIDAKLYMNKHGSRYESWAEEYIGMGFGNLRFVKKLELYSGSVTPDSIGSYGTNADTGYTAVLPLPEDELIKSNIETTGVKVQAEPDVF